MDRPVYNGSVMNLMTAQWVFFSAHLPPRSAVIAAHAQSLGDYNTWDYEAKYGKLVRENSRIVACGDFSTWKEKGL